MSHEAIATRFDEWAESGKGEGMEKSHGDVVAQAMERIEVRAGYRVLDLGCGTGWATRLLAQAAPGVQAIGIDVSPGMVAKAEELSSLRIRARYEVGSFESLDFPEDHFDLAFSMEALYYAVDLGAALAELRRVLKPGGRAHVIVDSYAERPGTAAWSEYMGLQLHHLPEAGWAAAFKDSGFSSVEVTRVRDSRGAGEAADFQASACFPDWDTYVEFHDAGSLWIQAAD